MEHAEELLLDKEGTTYAVRDACIVDLLRGQLTQQQEQQLTLDEYVGGLILTAEANNRSCAHQAQTCRVTRLLA